MRFQSGNLPDPYRFLFPLGVLSSLIGIGLWLMLTEGWISFYPRQAHANIMYFCFLWPFVAGFLMTAVPKMTGTSRAHVIEMGLAMLLVVAQLGFNLSNLFLQSVFFFGLQTLFLMGFVGRRFLIKRQIPFEGFLFVPFAFCQGLLSVALIFKTPAISAEYFYLLSGEAFILNLIMGLGTRLIPVLSRVPNSLTPDMKAPQTKWGQTFTLALALNLGFWMQTLGFFYVGVGLRLLVLTWVAIKGFKVLSPVMVRSFVALGLRCGVLFMFLSYALALFYPTYLMSLQHLLYIGGFVLITFMVGTRVMLAHGGENLSYETDSKRIGFVALSLAFASCFRVFSGAQFLGVTLKLAIVFFVFAAVLWIHKFFQILLKRKEL